MWQRKERGRARSALPACCLALLPYKQIPYSLQQSGIIPLRMWQLGLLWVSLDVLGFLRQQGSGISHSGHLGGAAAGLAFFAAYRRGRFNRRWW